MADVEPLPFGRSVNDAELMMRIVEAPRRARMRSSFRSLGRAARIS